MLDGEQTIGDLAATIAATYQVDLAMVVSDLLELSARLVGEELADAL
jgi:hypothetical protein